MGGHGALLCVVRSSAPKKVAAVPEHILKKRLVMSNGKACVGGMGCHGRWLQRPHLPAIRCKEGGCRSTDLSRMTRVE